MKPRVKVFLLLAAVLAGLAAGAAYTCWFNPEINWIEKLERAKRQALEKAEGSRVLICSGSSVLFGVDAGYIAHRIGRPVINLGFHAGMGAPAILGYAARFARSGDLLVVSVEPDLLAGSVSTGRLGNQFMVLAGLAEWAMGGIPPIADTGPAFLPEVYLDVACPGLSQLANHVGKILTGRPLYRYQDLEPDEYGYLPNKVTLDHAPTAGTPKISSAWIEALTKFTAIMKKKGVRLVYSFPWFETTMEPEVMKEVCRPYLTSISRIMPVLDDFDWEALTRAVNFSDMAGHLSRPGAALRSRALAQAILQEKYFVPTVPNIPPDKGEGDVSKGK